MMANLQIFNFQEDKVRVVIVDGEIEFVAKDVLDSMKSSTTVTALKNMIDEGLGEGFVSNQPLQTAGGMQNLMTLSEPALTLFLSRSRTEIGKKMNRWVHIEVLPTIRKTGSYIQFEDYTLQQRYFEIVNNDSLSDEDKKLEIKILLNEQERLQIEREKEKKKLKEEVIQEKIKMMNIKQSLENNLSHFGLTLNDSEEVDDIANRINQFFQTIFDNIDKLKEHKNQWYPVRVFVNNNFPNKFTQGQNRIIGRLCERLHIRLEIEKRFKNNDYRSDIIFAICDAAQHYSQIKMNIVLSCAEKYLELIFNDDENVLMFEE